MQVVAFVWLPTCSVQSCRSPSWHSAWPLWWVGRRKPDYAPDVEAENRAAAALLRGLQRLYRVMNLCILVFALAVALLDDVLSLERVALALAVMALRAVIAFVGSSVPYWSRLLDYARSEPPSQGSAALDQA